MELAQRTKTMEGFFLSGSLARLYSNKSLLLYFDIDYISPFSLVTFYNIKKRPIGHDAIMTPPTNGRGRHKYINDWRL